MTFKDFTTYLVCGIVFSFTSLSLAAEPLAEAPSQLHFGAAAELYVPLPVENAIPDGERARIRSIEMTSFGHFADTAPVTGIKLTIGANDLNGDLTINVREGFIVINDLLPALDVRAGKFFLPFGILNQTRRSAWSFISAPLAIERFLNDQGIADTGLDFRYTIASSFHLQAGITNGYRFDSGTVNGGAKPITPTHFARPSFDFALGDSTMTVGANYLMRVNELGARMRISGLDFSFLSEQWHGQAEVYVRATTPTNLPVTEDLGGYVFGERTIDKFAVGLRADYFQVRSLTDVNGNYRENKNLAFTPVFSFSARDHLKLQASYTFAVDTRAGDSTRVEQRMEFRLLSEFGEIPKSRNLTLGQSSL